MELVKTV